MLKIQNTFERTIFARVLERIDAGMHAKSLGSKFSHFFLQSHTSTTGLINQLYLFDNLIASDIFLFIRRRMDMERLQPRRPARQRNEDSFGL
jgi:hypothetical protein